MPKLYHHFKDRIRFDKDEFFKRWREAIPKYYKKYTNGEMTFEEQRAERVRETFGDSQLTNIVIKEVIAAFDNYFKEGWKLFPHAIEVLEYLKDFRKGIITNGSTKQQNDKIDILGIRKYFEYKRHPGTIKKAMVALEECGRLVRRWKYFTARSMIAASGWWRRTSATILGRSSTKNSSRCYSEGSMTVR